MVLVRDKKNFDRNEQSTKNNVSFYENSMRSNSKKNENNIEKMIVIYIFKLFITNK